MKPTKILKSSKLLATVHNQSKLISILMGTSFTLKELKTKEDPFNHLNCNRFAKVTSKYIWTNNTGPSVEGSVGLPDYVIGF